MKKILIEQLNKSKRLMNINEAISISPAVEGIIGRLFTSMKNEQGAITQAIEKQIGKKLQGGGYNGLINALRNGDIESKEVLNIITTVFKNTGKGLNELVNLISTTSPNFTSILKSVAKKDTSMDIILRSIPELSELPKELYTKYLESVGFKSLSSIKQVVSMISTKEMKELFPILLQKKWFGLFTKYPGIIKGAEQEFLQKYEGKNANFVKDDLKKLLQSKTNEVLTTNNLVKKNIFETASSLLNIITPEVGIGTVIKRGVGSAIGLITIYALYKLVGIAISDDTIITQGMNYYDKTKQQQQQKNKTQPTNVVQKEKIDW